MAHDHPASRAEVVPADEDDEPLIRRRGHPHRDDPWFLADDDNNMPVKDLHVRNAILLRHAIEQRVADKALDAYVYMDLAWRWDPAHRFRGVDPDVMFVTPAPPQASRLKSLRAWAPGHVPPSLGVEIVSDRTARKDYVNAPGRYAAARIRELVVFDPDRHRLRDVDGPYVLQVWRRARNGRMVRHYAGDGPCESEALGAWLMVVGETLRVADDPEGTRLWPTREEAERAAKVVARVQADTERKRAEIERERAEIERERAERERERAEKERAEKDAARNVALRVLSRHIERRLGRELTEDERRGLARRLEADSAERIDEEVEALQGDALAGWVVRAGGER